MYKIGPIEFEDGWKAAISVQAARAGLSRRAWIAKVVIEALEREGERFHVEQEQVPSEAQISQSLKAISTWKEADLPE